MLHLSAAATMAVMSGSEHSPLSPKLEPRRPLHRLLHRAQIEPAISTGTRFSAARPRCHSQHWIHWCQWTQKSRSDMCVGAGLVDCVAAHLQLQLCTLAGFSEALQALATARTCCCNCGGCCCCCCYHFCCRRSAGASRTRHCARFCTARCTSVRR
jgi:hypothetical protein